MAAKSGRVNLHIVDFLRTVNKAKINIISPDDLFANILINKCQQQQQLKQQQK